ncbi:type II toxin-antitoxin system RelE/ParE family toxin [Burkholderia sp. Ac-20379]|uniref:type II toxin-antitoxin system RelE/ParE family toxin n=1 Tax=Burkholderia sp. Ac-20379 TaxID=2703900 RepID=UPI0019800CC7|nr:type II toxin-antitoxin system RelE/ParE family toxin [Burkholderia sp. Ac-20379]MBN3725524.1 type II toxin-antitoxin system RelE/ParE family toxin [Burkholderia sp. Ac-20379]
MGVEAREVRLTPMAQRDLEDIWSYTFEHWSLDQAERYVGEIIAMFEMLAQGKRVGKPSSARDDYLRYLVGSHVVFYREMPHTLDVIRVLHQRMDVDRHL